MGGGSFCIYGVPGLVFLFDFVSFMSITHCSFFYPPFIFLFNTVALGSLFFLHITFLKGYPVSYIFI